MLNGERIMRFSAVGSDGPESLGADCNLIDYFVSIFQTFASAPIFTYIAFALIDIDIYAIKRAGHIPC
jgi:hypothetical protein